MITIAGKKYAHNDREFIETLFHPGGTAAGFYKRHVRGLLLLDHQREPFAYIVNNPGQTPFFVTAHRTPEGLRYMHSTTTADEKRLGIDGLTYSQETDAAADALRQAGITQ